MTSTRALNDRLPGEVARVLHTAARGRQGAVAFMTAYQILCELPADLQRELSIEYGPAMGKGAGHNFSAATRVAQIARSLPGVQVEWLDTRSLSFDVGDDDVAAGHVLCGLFRLL